MFGFIGQIVLAMFHMATNALPSVAADGAFGRIRAIFQQRTVQVKLERALRQTIHTFERDYHQQQLLRELKAHGGFGLHSPLVPILALLADDPAHQDHYRTQLGEALHQLAPGVAPVQCQEAATHLADLLRKELAGIPEMVQVQSTLSRELSNQALDTIIMHLATVDLAPNLYDSLYHAATHEAQRLHHSKVSTADLLYALACRPNTVAGQALARVQLTPAKIEAAISAMLDERPIFYDQPSTAYDACITEARQIAGRRYAHYAFEQHVLEALINQADRNDDKGKGVRAVLGHLGVPTYTLRVALDDIASEESNVRDQPRDIAELSTLMDDDPADERGH